MDVLALLPGLLTPHLFINRSIMSRTIRSIPSRDYRRVKVKNQIIINDQAVDMMHDAGFHPSTRTKVKANFKYASDDFPSKVWDQIPKDLKDKFNL